MRKERVIAMIKVSVIVPVYNAQKYLKQCLDSLLSQTLREIEIICVDDGSADDSVKIIEQYAKEDGRVKLIRQKNLHAGVARNNGLKQAAGEYVVFLDSDDFFEKDMLSEMYEKCVADKAQICLCSGRIYNEVTGERERQNHYLNLQYLPESTPFSPEDIAPRIFNAIAPNPWTKMFERKYITDNGYQFQATKKVNDLFFVYSALAGADSITYVNKEFINYRCGNDNSLQGNTRELNFDFFTALSALKDSLCKKKLFSKFEQSFCNRALSSCLFALDHCSVEKNFKTLADELRTRIFYKLGLLGHSSGYFYIKKDFLRLMDIMQKSTEELWEERNALPAEPQAGVQPPDMSGWKRPITLIAEPPVKVSVIIPVYNVEQYLGECLDSVINSTLKDVEIICIDDGSTDSSPQILESYAKKDDRFKIITRHNGGPSAARNAGIRAASGEYILFLDSDDYIEPAALEYLYCESKADDLDQLFFDARIFYDKDDEEDAMRSGLDYTRKAEYNGVMTGRAMFEKMSGIGDFKPSECLQLIKRALLIDNSIFFMEGVLYEDNAFTIECLSVSKHVRHVDKAFYNRRLRKNSIMTGIVGIRSAYNYYLIIHRIEEIAQERNFSSDPDFYFALIVQMKRMCTTACERLNDVDDDDLNKFLLELDEKTAIDFFCQIKVLHDARLSAKEMMQRAQYFNEQLITSGFKWKCREAELKAGTAGGLGKNFLGRVKRLVKRIVK